LLSAARASLPSEIAAAAAADNGIHFCFRFRCIAFSF